jgi:DNA-binding HxlR family transcriptional regulator
MSQARKMVVTVLDTIVIKGKKMKNTTRILEAISAATEPVPLNTLKNDLGMSPGIISGSLASLMKSGRLERQQLTAEFGRKNIWGYVPKTIAKTSEKD